MKKIIIWLLNFFDNKKIEIFFLEKRECTKL